MSELVQNNGYLLALVLFALTATFWLISRLIDRKDHHFIAEQEHCMMMPEAALARRPKLVRTGSGEQAAEPCLWSVMFALLSAASGLGSLAMAVAAYFLGAG